jgi:transposase-like protein
VIAVVIVFVVVILIVALLTQKNIEEAARSIGIGHATLLRWLKEPEFDRPVGKLVAPSQA